MKRENKMNNKGFSLVELIIVVAIMAILIGVLAPQYIKYVEKSRQSTDLQNVQMVKTAIEAAAAGEDISSNATITISSTQISWDCTLTGVTSPINLKSTGWNPSGTSYEYNINTYTWPSAPASNENSKGPRYDIASVFK